MRQLTAHDPRQRHVVALMELGEGKVRLGLADLDQRTAVHGNQPEGREGT